jgi:hypothetical protein
LGPLDAIGHLLGLFMPAMCTAPIAAVLAKLVWRRDLARVAWWRLAAWSAAAGSLALLGGLVVLGRDGRLLSYGAMAAASALALWWVGFRPARH